MPNKNGVFYAKNSLFFCIFLDFRHRNACPCYAFLKKAAYQAILNPNCKLQSTFAAWWRTRRRQNAYALHRAAFATGATVGVLPQ
jgi:hypothetical protein